MRRLKNFIVDYADWSDSAYAIYWVCEDGETGAQLGEFALRSVTREPVNEADREFLLVERFAKKHARETGGRYQKDRGWVWETEKAAREFAYRLEAELKAAKSNRPLQEWEKQALAAGWKPPKGWTS